MGSQALRPRWRAALRTVAADACVVVLGIVVYFGTRGLTAGSPEVAQRHAEDILALEAALGLDVEASLQALVLDLDPLVTLANWVYIWGHWPVIAATLVWLALQNRTVFLRLRNAMIASGGLGLCVYTTYPVAPPRLMDRGFVDTVTEQSSAYRVLQPPAFVNQYAAMPSLHVGWDLVVGLALVAAGTTLTVRTIGRLMPGMMAAATVLTANHYVLDVVAGAAFGLAGWGVALWLERRRDARLQAQAPHDLPRQRTEEQQPCRDVEAS
jgi:membrane-associated phospholipid phosphatase